MMRILERVTIGCLSRRSSRIFALADFDLAR